MRLHLIIILIQTLVLNIPITFPGGRADPPSSSSFFSSSKQVKRRTNAHTNIHTHGCIYSPPCIVEEQGNVETHSQPLLGTQEHDAEQSMDRVLW